MTTEASPKPPPDGRYRPTVSTTSSTQLSQLSFIAESPNENDVELIELRHLLRFETDCTVPVLTILQRFIEQLILLDNKAYLLSKDNKRHFVSTTDLPTTPAELQKMFPATILHRRSGNRLVLRLSICSTKSFLELTQLGIVTWANRNKLRLETDIYNDDDVRDCLWIAGRDSKTSKPILQAYLNETLTNTALDPEEENMLHTYRTQHKLQQHDTPPFSIYWRNHIVYNKHTTRGLIIRCNATAQKFFVKFFTRANKCGAIPEQKGRFVPLAVSKQHEQATIQAMDGHNKYLTTTVSIPIIGLSFEALNTEIEVGDTGRATIESIIYTRCLSIEPTAKSKDLGRFNLICPITDKATTIDFINKDLPIMWTLLPPDIANKFDNALQISYPRLTSGFSGASAPSSTNASMLDDPQSIGSTTTTTNWTEPPEITRPPRYVSVIYKADNPIRPSFKTRDKNKVQFNSDKSHATTQSESDLSTLVTSIREEMQNEFKIHSELITALKDEISNLRQLPIPTHGAAATPTQQPGSHAPNDDVAALRKEIQELRQNIPTQPSMQDFSTLITAVVNNMVPLITAAVRQGLDADHDSIKRSRTGSTPTQFRTSQIQPINLLTTFTDDALVPSPPTTVDQYPPSDAPPNPTMPTSPLTPIQKGDQMIE